MSVHCPAWLETPAARAILQAIGELEAIRSRIEALRIEHPQLPLSWAASDFIGKLRVERAPVGLAHDGETVVEVSEGSAIGQLVAALEALAGAAHTPAKP